MSRSYRKPYSSVCHHDPNDKRIASRALRRTQNRALREAKNLEDWDEFLLPDIYEAPHNDVWGWSRDGNQTLQREPSWEEEFLFWMRLKPEDEATRLADEYFDKYNNWYAKLCRK
jgi:hypothetical protein